jgi:DNA polymerase I-like protein with 3'-5' exonuclease and polymerase domains
MTEEWVPEGIYPSLKGCPLIGVDVETCDPNLEEMGAGDIRRDGFICGISIATPSWARYYPIRHEGGGNLPQDVVIRWLKKELAGPEPKIGANFQYDLGWLAADGITVNGPKIDVQIAEALIDELRDDYTLDGIAKGYGLDGKNEAMLRFGAASRGWLTEKATKKNLWKLHSKYVGAYAIQDTALLHKIHTFQKIAIERDELKEVYDLEMGLIDVLFKMRMVGMPIDIDRAEQAIKKLGEEQKLAQKLANDTAGFAVDIWSGKEIEKAAIACGCQYPKTEKGNASFTAEWMATQTHPLFVNVLTARKLDRSGNVFIRNKILNASVRGRIHPNFKQTRRDDGGTRSGRFSSSNPNMQQVPARHPILAPLIRGIFIPDKGHMYGAYDYSQQEPRVTVHYGYLRGYPGSAEARDRYIADPHTDYHQMVADLARDVGGRDIGRKPAKTLNLGMAYGMGMHKLAASLGTDVEGAKPVFEAYHKAVPFVRCLGDDASRQARRRGWVKTILGRRRHFPGGEFAHKALNAAVQGSSADMIKKAMLDLFREGISMYNTVHDELGLPIPCSMHGDEILLDLKYAAKVRDIMLDCVKISVPLVVDVEIGPSWGECELNKELTYVQR